MILVRKLVALDIAFLGRGLIIAEFTLGVIGPLALGGFVVARRHSWLQYLLAFYFLALGVNYMPLLVYAICLRDRSEARKEVAQDLSADRPGMMRRYRRGSLLLLVPFLVPVLTLRQARAPPSDRLLLLSHPKQQQRKTTRKRFGDQTPDAVFRPSRIADHERGLCPRQREPTRLRLHHRRECETAAREHLAHDLSEGHAERCHENGGAAAVVVPAMIRWTHRSLREFARG